MRARDQLGAQRDVDSTYPRLMFSQIADQVGRDSASLVSTTLLTFRLSIVDDCRQFARTNE
jgi:hypothetical protein